MLDGIYILQTLGPEYRVCEFEDSSILTKNEFGKQIRDFKVLERNIRYFFQDSKVFLEAEDAVNYANTMLDTFKESGVEFKNGVRIIPPIDFKF